MDSRPDWPDLRGRRLYHAALPQRPGAGKRGRPLEPHHERDLGAFALEAGERECRPDLQRGTTVDLSCRRVRAFSGHPLDRPGDVVRSYIGVPDISDRIGRSSVRSDPSLRLCYFAAAFCDCTHCDDPPCWILEQCAGDDNGIYTRGKKFSSRPR